MTESAGNAPCGPQPQDLAVIERQLGRPPRGVLAVAHRCPCGLPDVVQTAPRLPDGTPFPTLYYLTCPRAAAAVSRLESAGLMRDMAGRLLADAELRSRYAAAHADYLVRRTEAARRAGLQPLPASTQSAGGMPDRVKCLHALVAQELAVPGSNPFGAEAARAAGEWWQAGPCVGDVLATGNDQSRATGGGRMTQRVAAIDCGTNSLRLLIADIDPVGHTLTDIKRRMEIVRLGQGVDATGQLAPAALERTFAVLAEYGAQIAAAGAGRVRMVATSAIRDASNADEFRRGVVGILGISPEVITGDEEARLSFAGATAELAAEVQGGHQPVPPYLVIDIGGGSTEFVLGGDPDTGGLSAISVDVGSVRLTERHLHSDPPDGSEVAAAIADIDTALADVAAAIPVKAARTLVGLAGSVTTISAIALDLPVYDAARTHHAWISADSVHSVTDQLLSQTREQRAAIGSLHPGRIDVIGAGALVLDRVMRRFGFAEYITSEHDILDGIAWSIVPGD